MQRRHLLVLSGALAGAALAGCLEVPSTEDSPVGTAMAGPEPDIDDSAVRSIVHQANGFTFDLYRQLLEHGDEANLFASPLSVTTAMAMAYAGARGETAQEMGEALRYEVDDDELHDAMGRLLALLDDRGGEAGDDEEGDPFELSLVNSAWGQADYPFEAAYLDVLESAYGSELREVDFIDEPEAAREEINAWVADETEDRIDELLPAGSIDELSRLVLVNAIYFLANWKHTFPEGATTSATFTAVDGADHEVDMMYHDDLSVPYAEVAGAQAVDLPYVGEEVSMLVILPPAGEFESYEGSFDGATLGEVVEALDEREGSVALPRFEFEASYDLVEVFEAMGIERAFDADRSDFTDLVIEEELPQEADDLHITDVFHDSFVAVDEAGTEAAAATAVIIGDESAPLDPFTFRADRPFLFVIRDRTTETVLFVGRVADPSEWD